MWELRYLPHQLFRISTESQVNSASGAEEIRHDRIIGALDLGKKQSWPLTVDNPAMDLGYLKPGVDFCRYLHKLPLLSEQRDKILDGSNTFSLRHICFRSIIPKVAPINSRRRCPWL